MHGEAWLLIEVHPSPTPGGNTQSSRKMRVQTCLKYFSWILKTVLPRLWYLEARFVPALFFLLQLNFLSFDFSSA